MALTDPIKNNPNASVSGGTTVVAALLAFSLTAVGVPLSPELAVIAAGVLTTAALAVGRRGIRGVVRMIWHGSEE
jgi:hypothetical protein